MLCSGLIMGHWAIGAALTYNVAPGNGYPGHIDPYPASAELSVKMKQFDMGAGWFRRDELPDEYQGQEMPVVNELPYLLFAPSRSARSVPMVIYFGGTGEQGTNLVAQFRQTTAFAKLTSAEFQKRHPCYVFAPMVPNGAVIRNALPEGGSKLADLICDAMYAVISSLKAPKVDTNRLYVTGLSWGGVAAFELSCSYPGRFAAAVPVACIQSPRRIPVGQPGNYWMLYNADSYKSERSRQAIREIENIVRAGGGDFRESTFPDAGHDAWTKAWREEAVWEWVFSKSSRSSGNHSKSLAITSDCDAFQIISHSECSASVPGKDEAHAPGRALDGLDATAYVSARDASRGDWFAIRFVRPLKGRFRLVSGLRDGTSILEHATVESSRDGKVWSREGAFSKKTGEARIEIRLPVVALRVVYLGSKPAPMVLRKIVCEK